jgi:hypothetical protein
MGPQYYDEKDRDIKARMETFYADSITINQSFWSEADTDTRFYVGDQQLFNEIYGNLPASRRRQFQFNRIRRIIQMVSGYQRRNRKSTTVIPIENGDQETADQFTKILFWLAQQESVLETISESFLGALITGMNLLQVWVDYRSDPVSGNIRIDNCSYNSFLIDPFFRKQDLSDCNAIWKRNYLTKREVLSLLPGKEEEIINLQGQDSRDGKFQFLPETYNYGNKNLLTYDEFYYRDYRTQRMLCDTQTGETMEWTGKDEDSLREYLRNYPQVTVIDQEIPTVNLAIAVQGKIMFNDRNPLGLDQYPFVLSLGYYNSETPYYPWRIQGMVRGLRDSQYLYNRRKVIELDILESQINSGFKYKEDALVNPKDIFLSGQGKGLALKKSAQMSDVEQIIAPQIPPSMIQLSQMLGDEIQQISGVNEELLGSATDEKAGILSMLRQGAGLTTLQQLFDQLDTTQKLLGKICMRIIQSNFTPGKVQKIIGAQPAGLFYNQAFGTYDAAVEEGLNTTTQKQLNFSQLMELKAAGVLIPDHVLLDASTLQNKNELIKAVMEANQQQQQIQQAQLQAETTESAARTELAKARATADEGLGLERLSRIEENRALAVERRAAAEKDHDLGLLSLVKALKEIDSIDIEQLEKLIYLSHAAESGLENKMSSTNSPSAKSPSSNVVRGPVNKTLSKKKPSAVTT